MHIPAAGQLNSLQEMDMHMYLVYPIDEAHELTHAVAVVVWRAECVFSNQPPRWEYYKIK
jgi:hypothetical protein